MFEIRPISWVCAQRPAPRYGATSAPALSCRLEPAPPGVPNVSAGWCVGAREVCQGWGVRLGPGAETRLCIGREGNPMESRSTVTVTGRRLEEDAIGPIDITGWIAMPREHFEVMVSAIDNGGD